jgi:hypothetical protein
MRREIISILLIGIIGLKKDGDVGAKRNKKET